MGDVPGPSTAPYFNPRKATENFCRLCQLIMTICSDLFRDVLSHYIKPADLMLELNNNRTKLERIMNAQQKEQIYLSSGATTLTPKDLDISVLYILLRNISKLPKHRNGWGNPPLDTDTCLAACIERIRIQRNLISGHSTIGEIEDAAFQDHWDELKNNILEIESQLIGGDMYERGVDELLSCDLNPTRSEKYVREFKNIQGELLIKREKMENLESAQKTTKRHLAVKRARLDDIEERQSTTTSQIRDLQTTLLTTIHDTFKDLETTLLTTMQARFAAMEEKQKAMLKVSTTTSRKRVLPRTSTNSTVPSVVWRSDITVAGYQNFGYMSFATPNIFWMRTSNRLLKVNSSGNILYDNDNLKIGREYPVNSYGYHTVTQKGDLLFLEDRCVKIFTSEGTLTTLFTAESEGRFTCIHSCSNGDILAAIDIGRSSKIERYNEEGISIQVIQKDNEGKDIFTSYTISSITENKNNQDILTSMVSKVVGVDKTGRYKFSYKGHPSEREFRPADISTDNLGQIFVGNDGWRVKPSIHLLNQEGHFIRFLLTEKKDGIKRPLSICVYGKELYLLNEGSNKISVYDYQPE